MTLLEALKPDGRKYIQPMNTPPNTYPIKLQLGTIKRLLKNLVDTNSCVHSPTGSTLWLNVQYCTEMNIPYHIKETVIEGKIWGFLFTMQPNN